MRRRSFLWCAVAAAAAPFVRAPRRGSYRPYEVGPGKEYASIQGALNQLWKDQGSATFVRDVSV